MNIEIDTTKMREAGEDILKLVEELKQTYNTMFERIANMPTKTKEWQGDSAVRFATKSSSEKKDYVAFTNDLYKYGKYLIDCANYYDNVKTRLDKDYV
jgi:uncharacterized protein YukE